MKIAFDRLPIHRKLVLVTLAVTAAALAFVMSGLVAVDLWRYRVTAQQDTDGLARVIAENTAAAVALGDADGAGVILASTRVRSSVTHACLYSVNGQLFARYERSPVSLCPAAGVISTGWNRVSASAAIVRNQRTLGTVYVERDLRTMWTSISVLAAAALLMLILAAGLAVPIAHRLSRSVSRPIVELAALARTIEGHSVPRELSRADSHESVEIEELRDAFSDMLTRIAEGNEALHRNDAELERLLTREREANRLKDEFLAALSHELRTPLNAIVGWSQILTATAVDEQTLVKATQSIARNAAAQKRVIEDLIDIARIASGKLQIRTEPLDLRRVVLEGVEILQPAATARHVTLQTTAPDRSCPTDGDSHRLHQVLSNLVMNAIKFSPDGGTVEIVLTATGAHYELRVVDSGIGIAAEFLPHVFDRFRQADGSLTKEHGGLGLGLAIVKELVTLHGGDVIAASAGRGHGATFTVRLPAPP